MVKKNIGSMLLCLGSIQMIVQPNQGLADEGNYGSPCCSSVIVPGEPLDPCLVNAGYLLPATITPNCSWNFYTKGDFIYYGANQEVSPPAAQRFNFVNGVNFQIARTTENLLQSSPYCPGFRVSIGLNLDSVVLDASYMRHHSDSTSNFNAGTNAGLAITTAAGSILQSSIPNQQPVLFSQIRSKRTLNVDSLLLSLQKPVYMGTRMTMNLSYGLLTYWTEQKWNFDCAALAAPPAGVRTSAGFASADHRGWAIGPNLGFRSLALFPCHLQAIFNLNLSLQYGYLTKAQTVTSFPQAPLSINNTTLTRDKAGYCQAVQSAEIGIGWGDYLFCDRYHLDLYVTYNFHSQYLIASGIPYSATAVDAYYFSYSLQGFAIGGRLDF